MSDIPEAFATAFGDHSSPGIPGSGVKQISKAEARALGGVIEQVINEFVALMILGQAKVYATEAARNADFANRPADSFALVWKDPTPAKNDISIRGAAVWEPLGLTLTASAVAEIASLVSRATTLESQTNGLLTRMTAAESAAAALVAGAPAGRSTLAGLATALDAAVAALKGAASGAGDTLKKLEDRIASEVTTRGLNDAGLQGQINTKADAAATAAALATKASTSALADGLATKGDAAATAAAQVTAAAALGLFSSVKGRAFTRPGDAPDLFSNQVTGKAKDRPPLAYGVRDESTALGAFWRIRGQDIDDPNGFRDVSTAADIEIESGHTYLVVGVFARLVNPPAPQPVRLRWADLNGLGAPTGASVTLKEAANPLVADGRVTLTAFVGKEGAALPIGATELDHVVDSAAVYGSAILRVISNGQETGVIALGVRDITDDIAGGADITAIIGALASDVAQVQASLGGKADQAALSAEFDRATARENEIEQQIGTYSTAIVDLSDRVGNFETSVGPLFSPTHDVLVAGAQHYMGVTGAGVPDFGPGFAPPNAPLFSARWPVAVIDDGNRVLWGYEPAPEGGAPIPNLPNPNWTPCNPDQASAGIHIKGQGYADLTGVDGGKYVGLGITDKTMRWTVNRAGLISLEEENLAPLSSLLSTVSKLIYIATIGQSLGAGIVGGSAITTVPPRPGRAVMWGPGGLRTLNSHHNGTLVNVKLPKTNLNDITDAVERLDVSAGETGWATMASLLTDTANGGYPANTAVMVACHNISGRPAADWAPGGYMFENMMIGVRRANVVAKLLGLQLEVPFICGVWGESNIGMTEAQIVEIMTTFQAAANTAIKAVTGQATNVRFVCDQVGSWSAYDRATSEVPLGQLHAAIAQPGKFICVGSKYDHAYHPDGIHMLAAGYRRQIGERFGRAMRRFIVDGSYTPLRPLLAQRDGASVAVTFVGNEGPVRLDAALITDPGNYGLEWAQVGGVARTIQSVVEGPAENMLTVNLSGNPGAITSATLSFGMTAAVGAASGPVTGARTCIRDSATYVSLDGSTLFNWCAHERIPVI